MLMTTLDGIEFASAYPDLLGKRVLITGIDNAQGVDIARAFAEQRTRLVLHVNEMTPEMEVLGEIVSHGALDVRLFDGPIGATDAAVDPPRYELLDPCARSRHAARQATPGMAPRGRATRNQRDRLGRVPVWADGA